MSLEDEFFVGWTRVLSAVDEKNMYVSLLDLYVHRFRQP